MSRYQNRSRSNGSKEKAKPVHAVRFFTGTSWVECSVWANKSDDRTNYSVTWNRSYFDTNDDEWKSTQTLWAGDLPHLEKALSEAYLYIQAQQ